MVKAFKDLNKAQQCDKLAQHEANILKDKADRDEIHYWEVNGLNQYDKHYRMVYHEVNYSIQEVEYDL